MHPDRKYWVYVKYLYERVAIVCMGKREKSAALFLFSIHFLFFVKQWILFVLTACLTDDHILAAASDTFQYDP